MGNCLVIHQDREEIKIVSVDGSQVLKMPTTPSSMVQEEALQSVLPAAAAAAAVGDPAGAVRVKLVISKQDLKKVLEKEGVSLDDMVCLMRQAAGDPPIQEEECCGGWRPALQSIPEGSDL
ncbi:hypothetical protein U9M48_005194 [Paspalum notatum var. saurae]|uniref:Uncharacterized protein n=1 Tax=Paspalum notatum var. saurae TaxID=547442 RepID=A0AAQ3PUZ7_PASNO